MSATHPVPVAKDGRCSKAAEADAIELYPTAADSLALVARILLPKIWRLERALIAALIGLAAATVWTQVTDDRDALRMSLLWGAVALAPFLLLRAVIPANATKRRWYRALAVLESFMAGAVVGLAGWWLAPGRFVTNVGWAAGLAVGGGVLALLLRATGWWRPYEEGLEISATARRLAGLALAALGAGSVAAALATHTWQIAVAGLTLSVAAHIGWRMRGAPGSTRGCWWRFGAHGTAYVAQLVAVLFLLDAFVVPDRTHDALWAAVAGLPGGLLLMLLVGVPLLFVLWAGPAWGAGRLKGVHIGGGWGVIGRFVRGSLWLAMAGFVFGYWHLLDLIGVGTESRRAAITAFMTVVVPVAAVFALDSVRRRTRAGLVYKVAAAALIAAVAAPVTLWAGGTWVPHAIVAGAVLLAVVLAGVVIAHLTFLGAPALLCDRHAHRDREQLSLAEADSVIEWRRGGEAPKDRRVRRRANIVFPGATRPWGPLQKKIAEVCDVDEPPFFRKGFLTVDAREDGLTIQPYEVTGEGPTTSTPGEPIHVEYGTL